MLGAGEVGKDGRGWGLGSVHLGNAIRTFLFFLFFLNRRRRICRRLGVVNGDSLRSGDSCAASAVLKSHSVSEHLHTNHQTVFTGAEIKKKLYKPASCRFLLTTPTIYVFIVGFGFCADASDLGTSS